MLLVAANLVAVGLLLGYLNGGAESRAAEESLGSRAAADLLGSGALGQSLGSRAPEESLGSGALGQSLRSEGRADFATTDPVGAFAAEALAPSTGRGGGASAAPLDAVLSKRIEAHVAAAVAEAKKLSKGKVTGANTVVAVRVWDPAEERELVARQADRALRPASNMKLVTSAAALVALGASGEFETRFDTTAELSGGVLQGDLVVHAGGDPLYDSAADGQVRQLLASVVAQLREAGVREVAGDLILDEGSFLVPGPAPGWPPSNQYWQEHCALSGGFSANGGCLTAVVRAGKNGAQAFSEVRPRENGLQRVGSVKTVSAKARLDIAVGATAAKATLRGSIPSSVEAWSSRFAHPDPVALFGTCLRDALESGGVRVRGKVLRRRGLPNGRMLALLRTPIADVLAPINAESNNAVADQLFLMLGDRVAGAGTREGGRRATAAALERLGVPTTGLEQVDGSGLSREDRVTARQLTALLDGVLELDPATRDAFVDSLAVAGESGSLEKRMRGTAAEGRVYAKTGWIRGTSALSGYADTRGGRRLAFSILVDYPDVSGLNTHAWKPMQDAICVELSEWKSSGSVVR